MTRADFFKRILGCVGLGAIAATVRPAKAEPITWPRDPIEFMSTQAMPQQGYTFRWTGAVSNDWREPKNWDLLYGDAHFEGSRHFYSYWEYDDIHRALKLYPGQDPNRLDTVMIEHGEVIMPVNIAVSLDSRVKGSGVWYRHANFGKGYRRGTWVLREGSTDWIEERWL